MASLRVPKLFLILSCLLILKCDNGNGAREIWSSETRNFVHVSDTNTIWTVANTHKRNMDENQFWIVGSPKKDVHHHDPLKNPHMNHNHASILGLFFHLSDLHEGKVMTIHFPRNEPSLLGSFLPRDQLDSIPFSSKHLPNILKTLDVPRGSSMAKSIEGTLARCEGEAVEGEAKVCATSLESMVDFVRSVFGSNVPFKAMSTRYPKPSVALAQNFTVLGAPREVVAPKMVGCHMMTYPYAVFYCHAQEGERNGEKTKVFEVSLRGENGGGRFEAVAVCHMDTSHWDPQHISFHVLGIKPGSDSPVCHFFPPTNLVWVPIITSSLA